MPVSKEHVPSELLHDEEVVKLVVALGEVDLQILRLLLPSL